MKPLGGMLVNSEYSVDRLYMTDEQLTAAWRSFQAQKALNRGDSAGAARALESVPGKKELEDFVRFRGYRNNKGLYYLRGGR